VGVHEGERADAGLAVPRRGPLGAARARARGLFCGLNALPKTWHLKTYSYRTTRAQQVAFFEALQPRLRDPGLLGEQGLNLDFHAIMSYGEETIFEKHYVPGRSQRTRSVLTFIAQDGAEHTIIYANAELTARAQSGEVIEFARFYEKTHCALPKLLVFDGKLADHEHLAELDEMGVGFITLRQRSPKLIAALGALPTSARTKTRLDRAGPATSRSPSDAAPTPPHCSTPHTRTSASKCPGGADAPSATASPPDSPKSQKTQSN